jgi:hypothetical protein
LTRHTRKASIATKITVTVLRLRKQREADNDARRRAWRGMVISDNASHWATALARRAGFWPSYRECGRPLASEARKVLARAHGLCEGCGERTATQVHHLSYKRVFDEMLFDLVAVCDACHDKLHAEEYRRTTPASSMRSRRA